jgi:(E)-4-hydroxy-3-methylbut-2-enyl-diphosphate synthase
MERKTKQIRIGRIMVGGGAPVSIQTMAKAHPTDVSTIISQLKEAKVAGCQIARIAVPNSQAAESIPKIRERTGLPIVADVHFDYRLAIQAAKYGADALRVNPGTLGGKKALRLVVQTASDAHIPIRIGINTGSLPKKRKHLRQTIAQQMVDAAYNMVDEIQGLGFENIKVSLKSFDIPTLVSANRLFAKSSDLPLHLGVTEAGPVLAGSIRSAAGLSLLLSEGIGDTIRISLAASPTVEVRAARYLLQALGLRKGWQVVACPTCGRTNVDLIPVCERVERLLDEIKVDLTVAVMGCEVNGPGEARAADVGIAFGSKGIGLLFIRKTPPIKYPNDELEQALYDYLNKIKSTSIQNQLNVSA